MTLLIQASKAGKDHKNVVDDEEKKMCLKLRFYSESLTKVLEENEVCESSMDEDGKINEVKFASNNDILAKCPTIKPEQLVKLLQPCVTVTRHLDPDCVSGVVTTVNMTHGHHTAQCLCQSIKLRLVTNLITSSILGCPHHVNQEMLEKKEKKEKLEDFMVGKDKAAHKDYFFKKHLQQYLEEGGKIVACL